MFACEFPGESRIIVSRKAIEVGHIREPCLELHLKTRALKSIATSLTEIEGNVRGEARESVLLSQLTLTVQSLRKTVHQ